MLGFRKNTDSAGNTPRKGLLANSPLLRGRGWMIVLGANLVVAAACSLAIVSLAIECSDSDYSIKKKTDEIRKKESYYAKLEVERGHLLAPDELRQKAKELGMREPTPGQIRRVAAARKPTARGQTSR